MLAIASACEEPQSLESRPQALLTDGATLAVDVNTTPALPDVNSTSSIDPDGYTVWVDGSASRCCTHSRTPSVQLSGRTAGCPVATAPTGLLPRAGPVSRARL